ncbi:MAG: tRNA (adenosine(37)-N6)-threonylcarbamoyltransferase complex dimerization subunit type 1 TsaB [Spirochaetaceae bacterium]|jgi:tRNA threonylcarbamoyladenosine biosynthesis protein TsaB|nr:tRNA (adenosine(37)-N6)-threonylcarbamoyltransferase complex dimerization subunit type 1 TsaB [Spirochaetaceae bacterium]
MTDTPSALKALAIDSAASRLEIAAVNGALSVSLSLDRGLHMAEGLIPALEDVLNHAGLAPGDLDFIALNRGPGSFTSLRLGFALAKGLSFQGGCPVYAVPAMALYARPFRQFHAAVVPAIDAKRHRFYAAVFRQGAETVPAGDYTPEAIAAFLDPEEPALLAGPDGALLRDALWGIRPEARLFSVESPVQSAQALLELASLSRNAGAPPLRDFEGPLYIRLSEAEEGAA